MISPARSSSSVVAYPRAMREELLDRHRIVDQRQVIAEYRPRRRREVEHPDLDEAHHGERRHSFDAARHREARVGGVRDLPPAIRESIRRLEDDLVAAIDAHDARERRLGRDCVQSFREVGHDRDASAARG